MKLEKAIEIANLNLRLATERMPPDVKDALKLLIESGKHTLSSRNPDGVPPYNLLPGEITE